MTDGLTDAAKKEIQDAIRIVREDRFEKYVRSRTTKPDDVKPDDAPPTVIPPTPKPEDAPPNPNDPPTDKQYSRYWGEIFQ